MNSYEKRMCDILREGADIGGFLAVKAEFEAEGTRTDELLRLLEIARRAGVNVGVKIGGCEAIRDLIECRQFGVDYVIAPMVETPYALSKFVAARDKVFTQEERADIGFLFNVETITTFNNLVAMGEIAGRDKVGMVFGRVDFAGSLALDRRAVNTPETTDAVVRVAEVAAEHDVDLVVGGGVSPEAVDSLVRVRKTKLTRFETRKIIFDAACLEDGRVMAGLALAIEFELLWLKNKRDYYQTIGSEDDARIMMMEARQRIKAPLRGIA
ncbi:MAG: aldolase/citrate lyase family protein [Sphingomonas sp.]